MKKAKITAALFCLLLNANLKAQELKPLWARSGFGSSSIVISQDKNYLLSYSTTLGIEPGTQTEGTFHELRLWRISDANFYKTSYSSNEAAGMGSIIDAPIASTDRSKVFFLTYPYPYLHHYGGPHPSDYYSFDSAYVTMLDFQDSLHELFRTRFFPSNAKFEFTKNSKQVIVYMNDTAMYFDAESGSVEKIIPFKYYHSANVVFSIDSMFKSQLEQNKLIISKWDGKEFSQIAIIDSGISTLAFSPDSKIIFYKRGTDQYPEYNIAKIESDSIIILNTFTSPWQEVNFAFSPDSRFLLTNYYQVISIAEYQDTIYVWDLQSGKLFRTLFAELNQAPSFYFFLDSELYTGNTKLYNWHYPSFDYGGVIIEDGYVFNDISSKASKVLSSYGSTLQVSDLKTGRKILKFNNYSPDFITEAHFIDTGNKIVSSYRSGSVAFFDANTGTIIDTFPIQENTRQTVSQDGKYIVSADYSNLNYYQTRLIIRNTQTKKNVLDKTIDHPIVGSIAISPDNKLLVATRGYADYHDSVVYIFNLYDGSLKDSIILPGCNNGGIIFSPDSKKIWVFSGYYPYFPVPVWLIDASTLQILTAPFVGTFTPDGKYLASQDTKTIFTSLDTPQILNFFINDGIPISEVLDDIGIKSISEGFSEDAKYFGKGNGAIAVYALPPFPNSSVKNFQGKDLSSIFIYPNPSSGRLNIKLREDNSEASELVIFDLLGRRVFTQNISSNQKTIDISDLPEGNYTITYRTESGVVANKLVLIK